MKRTFFFSVTSLPLRMMSSSEPLNWSISFPAFSSCLTALPMNSRSLTMSSIELLEGMSATQIPASRAGLYTSSPPTLLMPDVKMMSGLSATSASLSGAIISNCLIDDASVEEAASDDEAAVASVSDAAYTAEFVSIAMILSPRPRSIRNLVVDGAIETIFSTLSGR